MTQELRDLENMQAGNGSTDYEDKKQACLKESESLRRQIVQLEREQEQTELALEDSKSKLEQLEHIHEAKETETLDKSPPFRFVPAMSFLNCPENFSISILTSLLSNGTTTPYLALLEQFIFLVTSKSFLSTKTNPSLKSPMKSGLC